MRAKIADFASIAPAIYRVGRCRATGGEDSREAPGEDRDRLGLEFGAHGSGGHRLSTDRGAADSPAEPDLSPRPLEGFDDHR